MFDISFGELLVIGAVALVVIGPERLPAVARTIGAMVGRLQRYVAGVKADLQREVDLENLRRLETEMNAEGRRLGEALQGELSTVDTALSAAATTTRENLSDAVSPSPGSSAPDKVQGDLFAPPASTPVHPPRDRR